MHSLAVMMMDRVLSDATRVRRSCYDATAAFAILPSYRTLLLKVNKTLNEEDVINLKFLLRDLLPIKDLDGKSFLDVIKSLEQSGKLSESDPKLLIHHLAALRHRSLARELNQGVSLPRDETFETVNQWRLAVLRCSEDVGDETLKTIKLLCGGLLSERTIESAKLLIELVIAMEKQMNKDHLTRHIEYWMHSLNKHKLANNLIAVASRLAMHQTPVRMQQLQLVPQQILHTIPSIPTTVHSNKLNVSSQSFYKPVEQHKLNLGSVQKATQGSGSRQGFSLGSTDQKSTKMNPLTLESPLSFGNHCALPVKPTKPTNYSPYHHLPSHHSPSHHSPMAQPQDDVYNLSYKYPGFCIIINNKEFYHQFDDDESVPLSNRPGSDIDQNNLIGIFEKHLKFKTHVYEDRTKGEMIELVNNLGQDNFSEFGMLVVVIMSHGKENSVYGTDGIPVSLDELKKPFEATRCPSLAGKPKLFLIQACQGSEKQEYVFSDGPNSSKLMDQKENPHDACKKNDNSSESSMSSAMADSKSPKSSTNSKPNIGVNLKPKDFSKAIPNAADFFFSFASVQGFESYRTSSGGSWYVSAVCNQISKWAEREHFADLHMRIAREVGERYGINKDSHVKQMVEYKSTLSKKVYLKL